MVTFLPHKSKTKKDFYINLQTCQCYNIAYLDSFPICVFHDLWKWPSKTFPIRRWKDVFYYFDNKTLAAKSVLLKSWNIQYAKTRSDHLITALRYRPAFTFLEKHRCKPY